MEIQINPNVNFSNFQADEKFSFSKFFRRLGVAQKMSEQHKLKVTKFGHQIVRNFSMAAVNLVIRASEPLPPGLIGLTLSGLVLETKCPHPEGFS